MMRLVEKLDGITINRMNGNLEAPFFVNENNYENLKFQHKGLAKEDNFSGHKYTAYIYNATALRRIRTENPERLFVICVRNPVRSLISWHEMHRNIATTGSNLQHFVNKDQVTRDFYINATIEEYYVKFAKDRLRYAFYIRRMRKILNNPKIMFISQEYLACNSKRSLGSLR